MDDIEQFALALASSLLDILEPLPRLARSSSEFADLLESMGWTVPDGTDLTDVREPFDVSATLTDVRETIMTGDFENPATLAAAVSAVSDLVTLVQALTTGPPNMAALPAPFNSTDFWQPFAGELFQVLVIRMIDEARPGLAALLALVGVIDESDVPDAPPRLAHRRQALDFGNLVAFLANPLDHMRDQFGWGGGRALNQDRVLTRLGRLVSLLGPASVGRPQADVTTPYWAASAPALPALRQLVGTLFQAYDVDSGDFAQVTMSALPIPARNTDTGDPVGLSLQLAASGGGTITESIDLGPFALVLSGGLQAHGALTVELRPDGIDARIQGTGATVQSALALRRDKPLVLIGAPQGMRVEIGTMELGVGVALSDGGDVEFSAGLDAQKLAFVIQASSADSFLGHFLGTDPQSVSLDLNITWSSKTGIRLAAAGGFRFLISAHLDLVFLRIETILIELTAATGTDIALNLAVDVVLTLGPVVATVSRVGARVLATPKPAGSPGTLGPLDLGFGFKPPDGAGLLIDASVVKGGGYALFDYAAGQYAGILQITIQDYLAITAIGLIATKMPDGSQGFSLLVILTAAFPPIQLGYGITLNGVGGIFGFNRTMALEVLRAGARTGILDSILFPPDPLANVPKVLSDVQSVFPIARDRFVIGLMARLAWASQLVIVDLGVVIEVPAPIAIALLGRVSIALPDADDAVVELHLDIIGIIDLGRGELSIDATLHDSRVAVFNLTGDIALRVGWGATKMFAVSCGGFNPRFDPPPGFPQLRRLAITLATTDNPLVRLDSYFALTANSLQTGARLDVSAKLDAGALGLFSAQANLGFDVLIIFNPFSFVAELQGSADIRRNGNSLLTAKIYLSLTGPQPMHAWGYAEIDFFGKHRIGVDVTMGADPAAQAVVVGDPLGDLVAALADVRNWAAQLPDAGSGVATLREISAPGVLAHPLGRLEVRQRVVPLGVTIDLYGGAPAPADARRFDVAFTVGTAAAQAVPDEIREDMAPGQYFALTDDQKLSLPAFEPLVAGYAGIGTPALQVGASVAGADGYETRVVDAPDAPPRVVADGYTVATGVLDALAAGRSAAAGPRYDGPSLGIVVSKQAYRLASTTDMTPTATGYASSVEAAEARPAAGAGLQIVGAHEVAP
jgi:hypothetical protein